MISELSKERIVILSTHIVSDVEYIANEIWLMKNGRLVQQGSLNDVLDSMPEKVWSLVTSQEEAAKLMKEYRVSNMKTDRDGVELRIISAQPPCDDAKVLQPNLEDVFLYYFGEKGGEME